jgi:hypothetical protein
MRDEELKEIGEWINQQGYDLDLTDCFWMEGFIVDHKFRDIAQLLFDYQKDKSTFEYKLKK